MCSQCERPPGDFSDLDDPLDAPQGGGQGSEGGFLEHATKWAQGAGDKRCPKCGGSGRFRSKYTGRDCGECLTCKGTGRVHAGYKPMGALKMDPASVARRDKARARRAADARAEEQDRAQAVASYEAAHPAQIAWLRGKQTASNGTGEFARSVYAAFLRFGYLTDGQLAAIDRNIAREAQWAQERAAKQAAKPSPGSGFRIDPARVPSGMYAVPGGETRLKVRIRHVDEGKWAGWTFVDDGAAYGQGNKYGKQRPGGVYEGQIEAQLRAICADPQAACAAYGRLVGRCGICGRLLEDAESVARGIGPICAGRAGW